MSFVLDEEKTWVQRDFGLDRRLCKALAKLGYVYPTLVQAKALPIALQGKDLLVRARTGSGKTVAFGLPLLHKLLTAKENNGSQKFVFGVVLAPTKELCKQIEKNLTDLVYYCKDIVSVVSIVDENPAAVQYRLQNKPDIIISTPSKLIQQIQSGKVDLSQAKTLVIDEADLVLSFGYADEVQAITAKMPKIFQGLFMSATLSPELDKFKRVVLHNPAILKLEESKSVGNLLQFYLPVCDRDKFLVLYVFLKLGLLQGKGLIFVNDIDRCYRLKLFLQQFYVSSAVLNSEMPLNSRLHIIDEFNRGVFDYLIATDASIDNGNDDESDDDDEDNIENAKEVMSDNEDDEEDNEEENDDNEESEDDENEDEEDNDVDNEGDDNDEEDAVKMEAANPNDFVDNNNSKNKSKSKKRRSDAISGYGVSRGLDFQGVSFVINFDFPVTSAAYTHRIGRTARGGATGTALSLVAVPGPNPKEYDYQIAERDQQVLREVRSQQPRLGNVEGDNLLAVMGSVNNNDASMDDENTMQPSPLVFNMDELDTFRYRCEDTLRSVTGAAVKELRAAELKREILNSNKLKSYFSENPNDFKVLRHDCSVSHPIRPKEHLKHIPDYLVPQSMRGIASNSSGQGKKKKRRKAGGDSQNKIQQSKMRDPLLNPEQYQGQQNQTSHDDGDDDNDDHDGQSNKRQKRERIYTDGELKHSKTISGRKEWKIRHKKGEYNPKIAKKFATGNHVKGSFQRRKK